MAATVDCNARYVYLNPYEGAKAAVAEAARNLSCVGAEPLAVTDNLNFGSPEKPVGYWQLAEACRGLAEACQAFSTPVTGGNVSLYNETLDSNGVPQSIYPTPVVGMVGLVEDIAKVCGQGWRQTGDVIYLLGVTVGQESPTLTLGGSEYLAVLHGTVAGQPPAVDMALEQRVQQVCRTGIRNGWVRSAHDCAEGGLAIALAESCISGRRGAAIVLPVADQPSQRWDHLLFAEGGARIVVSVGVDQVSVWEAYLAEQLADSWQRLGTVGSATDPLSLTTKAGTAICTLGLSTMDDRWSGAIARRME